MSIFSLRGRQLLPAVSIVALALGVALAPALAAPPAASPRYDHWRVVKIIGPPGGTTDPAYFATTGKDDAWSWWNCSSACAPQGRHFLLEHWNGVHWTPMRMPSAVTGALGVAASSARNVWMVWVDGNIPNGTGHYAIWNGSWHLRELPRWVIGFSREGSYVATPVVFGPKSAWIFSVGRFYAQYNGRGWIKRYLPAVPFEFSVVSAKDVWALGFPLNGGGGEILLHWNGSSWHTLSIPKPRRIPPNSAVYNADLATTGAHSVWLARDITGSQGTRTLYLLHWTGRVWREVHFRFPTSYVDQAAPDGHGGLWLVANGSGPVYRWYFDHLLLTGHWTRQPPGTAKARFGQVVTLSWIPGTRSLWATGNLPPNNNSEFGAIFKYGP